ncbi:MAG TPA: hypothetical protein VGJ51_10450, partial [Candidatus Angelobacter sp.]
MRTALLVLACVSTCCGQGPANPKHSELKKTSATACDTTTVPPPDSNFPRGFDYPQQVQSWVQTGNGERMRLHGWCLFAGLNQVFKPNGP